MGIKYAISNDAHSTGNTLAINGLNSHALVPAGAVSNFEDRFNNEWTTNIVDYYNITQVDSEINTLQSLVEGYIDAEIVTLSEDTQNNIDASVTEIYGSVVTNDGVAASMYSLHVEADDIVAGYEIGALSGGGHVPNSYFKIMANYFAVYGQAVVDGDLETEIIDGVTVPVYGSPLDGFGNPAPAFTISKVGLEYQINFNGKVVFENLTNENGITIIDGGRLSTDRLWANEITLGSSNLNRHIGNWSGTTTNNSVTYSTKEESFTQFIIDSLVSIDAMYSDANQAAGIKYEIKEGDSFYDNDLKAMFNFSGIPNGTNSDAELLTNWQTTAKTGATRFVKSLFHAGPTDEVVEAPGPLEVADENGYYDINGNYFPPVLPSVGYWVEDKPAVAYEDGTVWETRRDFIYDPETNTYTVDSSDSWTTPVDIGSAAPIKGTDYWDGDSTFYEFAYSQDATTPTGGSFDGSVFTYPVGWFDDATEAFAGANHVRTTVYVSKVKVTIDRSDPLNTVYTIGTWSVPSEWNGTGGSFKSTVFKRSTVALTAPTGGNYDSPLPTDASWTDGIPADNGSPLYASNRVFYSSQALDIESWSTPSVIGDTIDLDYEYSSVVSPGDPTSNPANWSNTSDSNTIWMALRKRTLGIWGSWEISKIKGEDGSDGIGIDGVRGSVSLTYEFTSNTQDYPTSAQLNTALANNPGVAASSEPTAKVGDNFSWVNLSTTSHGGSGKSEYTSGGWVLDLALKVNGDALVTGSLWSGGRITGGRITGSYGYFNQTDTDGGGTASLNVDGGSSGGGIYSINDSSAYRAGYFRNDNFGGVALEASSKNYAVAALCTGGGDGLPYAVSAISLDSTGKGVHGECAGGTGVYGEATTGWGGNFTTSTGAVACRGYSSGAGTGGMFISDSGIGVQGIGITYGIATDQDMFCAGTYGPFTGSHFHLSSEQAVVGDIIVATNTLNESVNQSYPYTNISTVSKDKRVFGICNGLDVPIPDLLLIKSTASEKYTVDEEVLVDDYYDDLKLKKLKKLITVKVEKTKLNQTGQEFVNDTIGYMLGKVNSLGEGMMNVCSEGGDIESGDYICSSNTKGKGMKQYDDLMHNYTVAKALEPVVWANEIDGVDGVYMTDGHKTKMIACTYHCG